MILSNDKSAVYVIQEPGAEVKTSQDATDSSATMTTITAPRRSVKKYVIIGVTCFVIVALLVTGALVAVKLITDAQRDIFNYQNRFHSGKTAIEDTFITQDDDSSHLLSYHIKTESGEAWGIVDYTQRSIVFKLDTGSGDLACFVDLNINPPSVDLLEASYRSDKTSDDDEVDSAVNTSRVQIKVLEGPLNNIFSLLKPSQQALCADAPIYLVDQVTDSTSVAATTPVKENLKQRRKRAFRCFLNFSSCQTIILSFRLYFYCPKVCVNI